MPGLRRLVDIQVGPVTLARILAERLDDSNLHVLTQDLSGLHGNPERELHLDFEKVTLITSAVLGKLVGLHKRVKDTGGRLVLTNLSPFLYELFRLTRLNTVLNLRANERLSA